MTDFNPVGLSAPQLLKHEDARHVHYYMALGRFVAFWSRLEHELDMIVSRLYFLAGGADHAPRAPMSLKMKIAFLRTSAQQIASLQDILPQINGIADRLDELREDRNVLMHFNWPDLISGPAIEEIAGAQIKPIRAGYVRMESKASLSAIHQLTNNVQAVSVRLLPILMRVGGRSAQPSTGSHTP